ncbi:MAG TPA: hypothetical protein VGG06_31535 [Thermoanaerobaculia bacterium]
MTTIKTQANDLRQEIVTHQTRLEEERNESSDREQRHIAQLAELNSKLEPFIEAAISRYPDLSVGDALEQLSRQLEEVRAMASHPLLSYYESRVFPDPEGPILRVYFKRSKEGPLGKLEFRIDIVPGSSGRIRDVGPYPMGLSVLSSLAIDGMTATIEFSVPGGDDPAVNIKLSGPAVIRVEGNYGLEPLVLEVM